MSEKLLSQNSQKIPQGELAKQLHQQVNENIEEIDALLSNLQEMKKVRKVMKECTKIIKEDEDEQRSHNLIWKHNEKHDYEFEIYNEPPIAIEDDSELPCIQVEIRNNWIQQYLDQRDVVVYGEIEGERVRLLEESKRMVKYELICSKSENSEDEIILVEDEKVLEIPLQTFESANNSIQIQFPHNKYLYNLSNNIVSLELPHNPNPQPNHETETIVLSLKNKLKESETIRRVLIFKSEPQEEEEEEILLYSRTERKMNNVIYDGYYEMTDFVQHIELPAGRYIFMPFSGTELSIYLQNKEQLHIVKEENRVEIKELNLMLQGFPECHPNRMKAEFIRECDLNKGIVIDIYRNISNNEIAFKNTNNFFKQEDKKLMFQSLYSKRYQSYRLKRGEVIVEFYEVTRKPAVLYQPQKKVIVDKDEDYQAKTVHLILK